MTKWIRTPLGLALLAFAPFFIGTLIFLKPHLGRVIRFNFPDIDHWKIFPERVVKTENPLPWLKTDQATLEPSAELAQELADLKTTALLVIRNGKIEFEKYDLDGGPNEKSNSFSASKSIVGLLTGIAQDRGLLKIDQPVLDFLPEWQTRFDPKLKIEHLLSMAAGINWNESYNNPFAMMAEAYYGDNLAKVLFRLRSIDEPGAKFEYAGGDTLLLSLIISRAAKMSLSDFTSEALWKPLRAEKDATFSLDHPDGIEKGFCCFNSNARDFARLGQLVLQKGMFDGKQIVSERYVQEMTTPKKVDYYGYQWWIEQGKFGPVPYARGILGQFIIVLPWKNAVIVRLGHKRGNRVDHTFHEVRSLIKWAETWN